MNNFNGESKTVRRADRLKLAAKLIFLLLKQTELNIFYPILTTVWTYNFLNIEHDSAKPSAI